MYSLIMRVRSSNAACSAEIFFLFFPIVIHQFQSDSLHVFTDVGENRHHDPDRFVINDGLHPEMMPRGVRSGKWLFQPVR